jgi:hypothetical protein
VGESAGHASLANALLPVVAHAARAGGGASSLGAVTGHVTWLTAVVASSFHR